MIENKIGRQKLDKLNQKIIRCKKCPRLASYIRTVAKVKVNRFHDQKYWGKPLTGYGDFNAELLLVGLAPAAHGGNRTGRMFTGDSSGDWVAKVLYENGFATKPTSERVGDGFRLINAYITASVRCAPPQNKPLKEELDNCSSYIKQELSILRNIKVIVCLGKIGFDSICKLLHIKGIKFSHGNLFNFERWIILCTYHPSRQNTQTGRLIWEQWSSIFSTAKRIIDETK
ncbi:MAG TPA: uracil-DNA glycosylase [Nitrosopumilaceae archaeon]|nr:uracil-DNA glycosylase [Nitrosopumilaceae archaeon]